MAKVLVLYYSMYGHIEIMANAVAEGARNVENTEVAVKRVPELMSEEVAQRVGAKLDQPAPIATVDELPNYDAIMALIASIPPSWTKSPKPMVQCREMFTKYLKKHWIPMAFLHRENQAYASFILTLSKT